MRKIFNGKRLREARLYNKMTLTDLAEKLDVRKQMVSKYENNRSVPTFENSLILQRLLGYPREFFYTNDRFDVENEGTFFRSRLTATQKAKQPAAIALKYTVIVRDFLEQYIDFPKLQNREIYEDIEDIENVAIKMRTTMNLGIEPIEDMVEIAELMGLTVINMNYQEEKIDAFSSMNSINDNDYFVLTTGDSESFYRQQFSIAHEIGHWALHQSINPQELDKEEYKTIEAEANKFASIFLLPRASFGEELKIMLVDEIETYYKLKKRWNVSMAAMIMRARNLGVITSEQQTKLYKQMHYRKWRNPEPFDLETKITVPVAFKQSIELLVDEGVLQGHEIPIEIANQYGLYLTPKMLAAICGVEPAVFADNNKSKVVLKIKDYK